MNTNKLFLICPDARLESFLQQKYGSNSFFLTALGAVFDFRSATYLETLLDVISREAIQEIIWVNDTSCRFIRSILERKKGYNTPAEAALLNLLIDEYSYITEDPALEEQVVRLASLNILHQAEVLFSNALFRQHALTAKIKFRGLITSRTEGTIQAVPTILTNPQYEPALTDR